MKQFLKITTVAALVAFMASSGVDAQQIPQLPTDPDVRIGRLDNGLTYYIRHNEYPKGQADFYIAQKVGSMQEEENQRGLAHFLEHMCFNGTTNYPDKNLINYLESIGVKFGANLNAVTDFDCTIYNISNVPVGREGAQDSCLLVLHDWANDLLLLPDEIDAERAVIHEEWRKSNVGQMRILERLLPVIYPGDKYGVRLPIGTMEIVDNFPYQDLRDYYEKWYRPDLQGIIIVGDINIDRIEAKIKEMFSDIEMPENPAERVYFPVSDNKGTIYAIGHDPEQTNAIVELMFKSEAFPDSLKNTPIYYVQNYVQEMIASMLNTRLADISSRPDAPFAFAQSSFGNFFISHTKDALTLIALAKDGDLPTAIAATYRELLRAVRGGFNPSEYDRARKEFISQIERAYNNRRQRETGRFVQDYVNNFIYHTPIPDIETEYQLELNIANSISLAQINEAVKGIISDDNRVLLAMLPEVEGMNYPTDNDFAQALAAVDGETIEKYEEDVKSEPLIPQLPEPGKIVSATHSNQWNAEVWTLSNGTTVIIKPTTFKDDEILFTAIANGGYSKFGDEYADDILFMDEILGQNGLGDYSNMDVQKYLAGKQAGVRMAWSPMSRSISGNTTPKDLPTLCELIYMSFTAPNFTDDEFDALKKSYLSVLHNQEADPMFIFQTKINESLFSTPRVGQLSSANVEKADKNRILEISKAMTANAAEFTFVFVGNVDVETLKPLVEQYIATLPSNTAAADKNPAYDTAFSIKGGNGTDTYSVTMQTPQTLALVLDWADIPFTSKNQKVASIAGQILSRRLNDIVREKEGAVYSIGAQASLSRRSPQSFTIQTGFPMKPEMKEKVLEIIRQQMEDMTHEITPSELAMVKEYMVKSLTEAKERNGNWLSAIAGWSLDGIDTFNGDIDQINAITDDDIKALMTEALRQNNYRIVILDPAE